RGAPDSAATRARNTRRGTERGSRAPSGLRSGVLGCGVAARRRCIRLDLLLRLVPQLLELGELLLLEFGFLVFPGVERDERLDKVILLLRRADIAIVLLDLVACATGIERQHERRWNLRRLLAVGFLLAEERPRCCFEVA